MCPGDEFGDGIIPDLSQPTNLDKCVNTSGPGGGSKIRSNVDSDCTPQMTAWINLLGDDQRQSRDLFDFTAANLFDSCHSSHPTDDFGPDIALCPIPNLAMEGQDEQETESSISYTEKDESPIVCLSNLMIDIHEAAKTLTDSPWAYPNHSTGLDSYPVGMVLQLAQDLFRILHGPISMTSTNHGSHSQGSTTTDTLQNRDHHLIPDLQSRTTNSSSTSTPPHQPAGLVITPHILLVMSCYTSLTKLYGIVMSHFHTHLRRSSERHSTQKLPLFDQNVSERLQLGELALPGDMWIKRYLIFSTQLRPR
ncbi:hypothetical protein N7501_006657 [Penicillium viridicatum]|nr:hypothetical protein N7501_006657 [Penicillium viridicatum]